VKIARNNCIFRKTKNTTWPDYNCFFIEAFWHQVNTLLNLPDIRQNYMFYTLQYSIFRVVLNTAKHLHVYIFIYIYTKPSALYFYIAEPAHPLGQIYMKTTSSGNQHGI
jgi:hypothetical protein